MKKRTGRLTVPINGEIISVPEIAHLKCPRCGEVILRLRDAQQLEDGANAIYRERHGLLSADEIREIRERLGLTQAALASLLRLGANTISRWESGRIVQSASMDVFLRLIRDLPGSVDYLRKRAA